MVRTRECTQEDIDTESGNQDRNCIPAGNPTCQYFQKEEKLHGFLSQQFPTIANPAPLGFFAFALTTWVYSMSITGAIVDLHANSQGIVFGLGLFYGGLCQFIAGMWEFKTGNTFGTVAFSSYGAFWMSTAAINIKAFGFLEPYGDSPQDMIDLNNAFGIYNLAWAIFSFTMLITAHRSTILLMVLFTFVTLTFTFLSISNFMQGDLYVQRVAGIFGIITSTIAGYCGVAGLLTKKNSLFMLPVGNMEDIYRRWGWLKEEDESETDMKSLK